MAQYWKQDAIIKGIERCVQLEYITLNKLVQVDAIKDIFLEELGKLEETEQRNADIEQLILLINKHFGHRAERIIEALKDY